MNQKPINIKAMIRLAKRFRREYWESGVSGISPGSQHGIPEVQIHEEALTEIAPLDQWVLNEDRKTEQYPYLHHIEIDGVMFFSISTDPIKGTG